MWIQHFHVTVFLLLPAFLFFLLRDLFFSLDLGEEFPVPSQVSVSVQVNCVPTDIYALLVVCQQGLGARSMWIQIQT